MANRFRFNNEFVSTATVHAIANNRSVPGQIEYWAGVGRMAEQNPDLTYEFIKQAIMAKAEVEAGKTAKYTKGQRDPE